MEERKGYNKGSEAKIIIEDNEILLWIESEAFEVFLDLNIVHENRQHALSFLTPSLLSEEIGDENNSL